MGMQIKKFKAPTLQKAIEQVRRELGDNAVILQADSVAKTGPMGGTEMEVTAAIDRKTLPHQFRVRLDDDSAERAIASSSGQKKKVGSWKEILTKPLSVGAKSKSKTTTARETSYVKERVQDVVRTNREASPKFSTNSQLNESLESSIALRTYIDPLKKEIEELRKSLVQPADKSARQASTALLETEIQSLRRTITNYIQERNYEKSEVSGDIQRLISFWQEHGVTNRQIFSFLSHLEKEGLQIAESTNPTLLREKIGAHIREARTTENPKQKIVTLIGPTGVGKTTTIAKLAAFEKLKMGRRVALVTIDDYKIGGTDQLNHYARILEVPFIKVRSDLGLEEQIKHLDIDTIFIDTFGVSPKDDDKIQKLRKSIRFLDPHLQSRQEVHLALPVGIASGDVESFMDGFSRLQPDYLLFTKWDETDNWGGMLASIMMMDKPVSFVGNGQEVPEDITIFSSDSFVQTITSLEN